MTSLDKNIVFFDSECVLCGNLLKLLLRIDKEEVLSFASLQSEFAAELLPKEFVEKANYKSVAFMEEGKLYFFSDAVIRIFSIIGLPWSITKLGYLLPKIWRDALYMKVSNNRYSWFGKSSNCIIPDANLRSRFLHEIRP